LLVVVEIMDIGIHQVGCKGGRGVGPSFVITGDEI
jgi:hypothetical protein